MGLPPLTELTLTVLLGRTFLLLMSLLARKVTSYNYDTIVYFHEVTKKMLPRESNYLVDVVK